MVRGSVLGVRSGVQLIRPALGGAVSGEVADAADAADAAADASALGAELIIAAQKLHSLLMYLFPFTSAVDAVGAGLFECSLRCLASVQRVGGKVPQLH